MDLLQASASLSVETSPLLFFAMFFSARARRSARIRRGVAAKWPLAGFHVAGTLCREAQGHLFFPRNQRAILGVTCSGR